MRTTNKFETAIGLSIFTPAEMLMYLSSSPCTHLFDQLPTDMIYYEIFRFLDYDSRVTANLLLHPEDRMRTPLRKEALTEFSMMFGSTVIKNLMRKQKTATTPIARNRLTLKIWRTMPMFPELVQYNSRFRATVLERAVEFSEIKPEETNVSAYTRKELKRLCENYIVALETSFPFVHELNASLEDWTAINY